MTNKRKKYKEPTYEEMYPTPPTLEEEERHLCYRCETEHPGVDHLAVPSKDYCPPCDAVLLHLCYNCGKVAPGEVEHAETYVPDVVDASGEVLSSSSRDFCLSCIASREKEKSLCWGCKIDKPEEVDHRGGGGKKDFCATCVSAAIIRNSL